MKQLLEIMTYILTAGFVAFMINWITKEYDPLVYHAAMDGIILTLLVRIKHGKNKL